MTEIEKLNQYAEGCICTACFLCGLAVGIVLAADLLRVEDPQRILCIEIGTIGMAIGIALTVLHDHIRKKIRTIETMESQDAEGGSL